MSRLEVETQSLEITARTLRNAADELRSSARRIGAALGLAGTAAGCGAFQQTAAEAGRRWADGLEQYAQAGQALSDATDAAAASYRLVEWQAGRVLTPVVAP